MTTDPAPGPAGPQGVIHDIGYRHLEGRRLGSGAIRRALYVESLRGCYGFGRSGRSKVAPFILLGIMLLPAFIMAALSASSGTFPTAGYAGYPINMQLIVMVFLASQAPQLVARDLRSRVLTLYFSRPLSRGDYVHAKLAAMTTSVVILLALPQTVLYGGALLGKLDAWQQTRNYLAGLATTLVLAAVLSGIALFIASVAPRRGIAAATVISFFVITWVTSDLLTAVAGRSTSPGPSDTIRPNYGGLISPFNLVDGVHSWVFHSAVNSPAGPPGTTGGIVFLVVMLLVPLAGYALLRARYRKVSIS